MYRAVIEHPDYMPDELKNRPENYWGHDRGRIYRVVMANAPAGRTDRGAPRLSQASNDNLTKFLEHPNSWHRETAARLLLERNEKSVAAALCSLAVRGTSPVARVRALWVLHGLHQLTSAVVLAALDDPDPRVRAHAVQLGEPWLNTDAKIRSRVLKLAAHADARLRFQVALSLGEVRQVEVDPDVERAVIAALGAIALRDASHRWTRAAVGTSLAKRASAVLRFVLDEAVKQDTLLPGLDELVGELAQLVGARQNPTEIAAVVEALRPLLSPSEGGGAHNRAIDQPGLTLALACIEGLGRGLIRRGASKLECLDKLSIADRLLVSRVFELAVDLARRDDGDSLHRRKAIQVLRHASFDAAGSTLLELAADNANQKVRLAAIEALARFDDPAIAPVLLRNFAGQTPAFRRAIIAAMLANSQRAHLLLDQMQGGHIAPTELQPNQWQVLATHRDANVKRRAEQLQAATMPANRQHAIETYRAALTLSADPRRGKQVFAKNCAGCHQVADVGVNVASDISDSRARSPEQLLVDILDPNRAIDNHYVTYTVMRTDGQVLTGIIGAETASSLTLRQQDNKSVTILRDDIEELRSNGVSLMPTGFEQNLSIPQMADLISFLKNWRYLDGQTQIERR